MSRVGGPVHHRMPSRQLQELPASDGILRPLLEERTVAGVGLDVHPSRGDEVDLRCRVTCLVRGGRS